MTGINSPWLKKLPRLLQGLKQQNVAARALQHFVLVRASHWEEANGTFIQNLPRKTETSKTKQNPTILKELHDKFCYLYFLSNSIAQRSQQNDPKYCSNCVDWADQRQQKTHFFWVLTCFSCVICCEEKKAEYLRKSFFHHTHRIKLYTTMKRGGMKVSLKAFASHVGQLKKGLVWVFLCFWGQWKRSGRPQVIHRDNENDNTASRNH